jgi:hypothetical protein
MHRRNFGRTSGIIVDVCSKHGTWFDAGELSRILTFVSSGGLAAAREAEAAEKRRLTARTGAVSAAESPMTWTIGTSDPAQRLSFADMEEATIAFVRWVKQMLL